MHIGSYALTISAKTKASARSEARDYISHTRDWQETGKPLSAYRLPRGTKVKEL